MSEQFKSIETTELVKIANAIRTKTGTTDKISLEDMPAKIAAIKSGAALPELKNEGSASDLLSGKQLIDSEGNIVEGTIATATQATPSITINASGLITATATQTAGYVAAGSKSSTHQLAFQAAKTITPKAASQIAVSSGYYTGGNITVAGDSNLVAGNIKSGVSIFGVAGTYEGSGGGSSADTSMEDGIITRTRSVYTNDRVKSIGSYAFYDNTKLTSVSFSACTTIGSSAFYNCNYLTSVSFPVCTTICSSAFYYCNRLKSVSFPVCTSINNYAFQYCGSLTTANFPACAYIGQSAFGRCSRLASVSFPVCNIIDAQAFKSCSALTTANFPACTSIAAAAFFNCSKLSKIYLTASSICSLDGSAVFSGTSIWSNKGSIYVPSSLVASYKAATNWAFFSNRIFSYTSTTHSGGWVE